MAHRVGVDVGGTFTDLVCVTDGAVQVQKVPSTPETPDDGVLDVLGRTDLDPATVDFLAHGTTVATNAVLEGTWADTALITTAGFRDVLEIGRQARPALYDLRAEKPDPIVPRDRRFEVAERLDERGRVDVPLESASIEHVMEAIAETDVESVAVSLLFSYENPEHERRIVEAIHRSHADIDTSRSSAVLPEIREYERTLATSLNAALVPIMDRYIGRLVDRLERFGIDAPLRLMQSNGGIIGTKRARNRPINALLSGPAAGVQGAAHVADLAGYQDVIAMDMGGTSCDVSLVEGGEPIVSTEVAVGNYPIGVPTVDIHTIGAGGGSIAWIDDGGALRVGPRSAGAEPGPVSYGRGGTAPTVTDAQVVLGRITPEAFLSDDLDPEPGAARRAIAERIAEPLGMDAEAAAAGIVRVANANMERAIRVVSVERGRDPRTFALVAFGGAGPLHAPAIARSLDIPRVLVPRFAGVLSALGLVLTDLLHDFSTSYVRLWGDVDPNAIEDRLAAFAERGRSRLVEDGIAADRIVEERFLDMRYGGQSYTLSVPAPSPIDKAAMETIAEQFHVRHEQRYGHASPEEPVELVTVRSRIKGSVDPPELRVTEPKTAPGPTSDRSRAVQFEEGAIETPVYDRTAVPVDSKLHGPAVIEGAESTVLVHPDQTATVDPYETLVVEDST